MHCNECAFWSTNQEGWGKCGSGKMQDVESSGTPRGTQNRGARRDMLLAIDPSGDAGVSFSPGPEFGCVHFRAVEQEEPETESTTDETGRDETK